MQNAEYPALAHGKGEDASQFGLSFHTNVNQDLNPPYPEKPIAFLLSSQYVGKVVYLDPRRVKPMKGQPREEFDGIDELAETLKKEGQQLPIIVHPISDPDYDVELQAGERRTHACIRAGLMVQAVIRLAPKTRQRHYVNAVVENFNRKDLTLLETVKMVARLIADGHGPKDIARMTGKTQTWVSQYTILSNMDLETLTLIGSQDTEQHSDTGRKLRRSTVLPLSIALQVAKLPLDQQMASARTMIDNNMSIADAQKFVRKEIVRAGGSVRQRSPEELFHKLTRGVDGIGVLLEEYLDLSDHAFSRVLEARDSMARTLLGQRIESVMSQMRILADAVSTKNRHPYAGVLYHQHKIPGWHPGIQQWCREQLISGAYKPE